MNNERRKRIEKLIETLGDAKSEIESLKAEEQDAYEAMPDGLKDSERGQLSEAAAANLENAESNLQDAIDALEEAKE